jgi:hypothetical protein
MDTSNIDDDLPSLAAGLSTEDDDYLYGIDPLLAAQHGLATNEHGGVYQRGKNYSTATKLPVGTRIKRISGYDIGAVNVSQVSPETKTSRHFVRKVHDEMVEDSSDILDPAVTVQQRVKGPGTHTFDEYDMYVLLLFYFEEPSHTNASYVERLYVMTGTITSTSTVFRWFNHYFPISGGFRKPNLVPIDKFKQENFWHAEEYLKAIATISPKKQRFGDEKLIKGAEVYCRRTRRCVLTGDSYCLSASLCKSNNILLSSFRRRSSYHSTIGF